MTNKLSLLLALIGLQLGNLLVAQAPAFPSISVPVFQNNTQLKYPFAGGLNAPQFSAADLNNDGAADLVVFDRSGDFVLPFLNNLTGGTAAYYYAPEYARTFPDLKDYVLLRDYDQDGAPDLFCAPTEPGFFEMRVFKGYYQDNVLHFKPVLFHYPGCTSCNPFYIYYPDQIPGLYNNFPISTSDYPAVEDIDNDGDLDIVAFSSGNSVYLTYLKNTSVEEGFGLDSLHFVLEDRCWGKMQENGLSECVSLLSDTPNECAVEFAPGELEERNGAHPGATVLPFDPDNDGDKDLLIGNISFDCLNYLTNGGSPTAAWMTAQDSVFPKEDVKVDLLSFPAAYFLDIDLDGSNDLLVSPNSPTLHEDRNNVWWYKVIPENGTATFELQTKKLFTSGMLDVGTATHPAFADVNGDGLQDLVVGNYGYYTPETPNMPGQFTNASLYLYLNTGTYSEPQFSLASSNWLGMASYAPNDYDFAPAFGDLDNDGDLDLLVGSNLGALYCFYNQAGPNQPMNLVQNFDLLWETMDVGLISTPCIYDLDEDGKVDVLMGERNGNINFYKNTGSNNEPNFDPNENTAPNIPTLGAINTQTAPNGIGFSSPQVILTATGPTLVTGTYDGHLEAYQLNGPTASAYPEINLKWGNVDVGRRSTPAFADLDDDGKLEMVVGNQRGGLNLFKTELVAYQAPVSTGSAPTTSLDFYLAPNPATSEVQLFTSGIPSEPKQWIIHDVLGKKLLSGTSSDAVLQLPIASLPKGTYLVELTANGKTGFRKLIK